MDDEVAPFLTMYINNDVYKHVISEEELFYLDREQKKSMLNCGVKNICRALNCGEYKKCFKNCDETFLSVVLTDDGLFDVKVYCRDSFNMENDVCNYLNSLVF